MNLDLRIPMGLMFLITGAMMTIFGIFTRGNAMYEKSVGVNINFYWGVVMFVFGTTMFLMGRRGQKRTDAEAAATVAPTIKPLSESKRPGGH